MGAVNDTDLQAAPSSLSSLDPARNVSSTPGTKSNVDFPALLEAFEEDCRIRNMTHESIRRYISAVRILHSFCCKDRINTIKIGSDGLVKFLTYLREERKNSPKQ